jgi:CYTH domain-containing protein
MHKETERKFLVTGSSWRRGAQGTLLRQGYLNSDKNRCVRIRTVGTNAYLTVKGLTVGYTRAEFEYAIPLEDCESMLENLAEKPIIEKTRYRIDAGNGLTWEIDEFHGVNEGLIVAEIELPDERTPFAKPDWLGREVSEDPRYFNSNLIARPYTSWKHSPSE